MQKQILKFIECQHGIPDTKFVPITFGTKTMWCTLMEILDLHIFGKTKLETHNSKLICTTLLLLQKIDIL